MYLSCSENHRSLTPCGLRAGSYLEKLDHPLANQLIGTHHILNCIGGGSSSGRHCRLAIGRCTAASLAAHTRQPNAVACAAASSPAQKNWVEAPAPLAIALLARAFTPLQLHPHRLLKSREFWTGFIEHFEGTRLGIPDVPRRPVEFVKGHNYWIGMTTKLKTLKNATCIK